MEAKTWPPRKFRHGTELGEAFEQTPARAILQSGRADGRRGRDGINGETGWRGVEIGRGSQAATCPVAMRESGWVWGASRMGRCSAASPRRAPASPPSG
jgi:hypothetical protein